MNDDQFSQHLDDPVFQEILVSCYKALEQGEQLDREALIKEHQKYAKTLQAFLDDEQFLRHMAAELRNSAIKQEGHVDFFDATIDSNPNTNEFTVGDKIRYIGEYEILAEIARGGMGVVFKARQQRLKRIVALKMILSGSLADDDEVERFRREAQAAAGLTHPNIVSIHEIGSHDGRHYFTMDFIEGRSLAEEIREESLPPRRAAKLVKTLAEAIYYAHEQGTLHRDLKPANVLIEAGDNPKITDFGLAKLIGIGDEESAADITASGQILGTPSYMSPEQAEGKHKLVGPATDIYSLGAILYASLAGRAPFVAETPVDTLLQVAHNEPVTPRSLNPKIPKELETICLKCLQKHPKTRYATAKDLADDLNRWLEGHSIRAKPTGPLKRAWKWSFRHPARASLILVLVVASITATLLWRRAEKASDLAAEQLYVNRIALAEREWQVHNRTRAMELLMQCDAERQGWEWRFASRLCFATPHINLPIAGRSVIGARFGPTGRYLATNDQTRMRIWDGRSLGLLYEINEPVFHFGFSPDGAQIAAAIGNNVKLFSTSTGENVGVLYSGKEKIQRVAFDPQGEHLALLDVTQTVILIDIAKQSEVNRFKVSEKEGMGRGAWLRFAPGSKKLMVSCANEKISFWDPFLGEKIDSAATPETKPALAGFTCAISADGVRIAYNGTIGGVNKRVQVHDLTTQKIYQINVNEGASAVAFSPDGKRLAIAVNEMNLGIEDLPGVKNDVAGFLRGMMALSVMDRPWRGMIYFYEIETGKLIRQLRGHSGAVSAHGMSFSPDGKRLVSAGGYRVSIRKDEFVGELKLWNAEDASPSLVLNGHTAEVPYVVFSSDGKLFASGGKDGVVRVWRSTGQLVRAFQTDDEVRGISFVGQDRQIVIAQRNKIVWKEIESGKTLHILQAKTNGSSRAS